MKKKKSQKTPDQYMLGELFQNSSHIKHELLENTIYLGHSSRYLSLIKGLSLIKKTVSLLIPYI